MIRIRILIAMMVLTHVVYFAALAAYTWSHP